MAKVFLSHSSKDKEFVRRLAYDLTELGHAVWLDEWEIRVGDCIVSGIERGLEDSDFVALVLSHASVRSGWVEREWKSKYWQEVQEKRVIVLPLLIESMESSSIPSLLRAKRYADFSEKYLAGLLDLTGGLDRQRPLKPEITGLQPQTVRESEVMSLLGAVSDASNPLSAVIPKVMEFATRLRLDELVDVCRCYLVGPTAAGYDDIEKAPAYAGVRCIKVFVGVGVEPNPQFMGWAGNPEAMFRFMESSKDFKFFRLNIDWPLAEIERRSKQANPTSSLVMTLTIGQIAPDAKNPDREINSFARGDSLAAILGAMRGDLVRRVTGLLPSLKGGDAGRIRVH
jgi:hypothetical protein